jgi:hypothetical protein
MIINDCLFACGSAGVKQSIPPNEWTKVKWPYVPVNTTPFTLNADMERWHCPSAAVGLWIVAPLVAWDNSASQGPHLRSIRVVQGAGYWIIPAETEDQCYVFAGDSPHAKKPFHQSGYLQMGLSNTPGGFFWIEVSHSNPVAQDIITIGMEAPLLMAVR